MVRGAVRINGEAGPFTPGTMLRADDEVELLLPEDQRSAMTPEHGALAVLWEDATMLVVDKPTGMLAHPTRNVKSGTLMNLLVGHLQRTGETWRPILINRLDQGTSGIMVVAKTGDTARELAARFASRNVSKEYVAIVDGIVASDEGLIDAPIGRNAELRCWEIREDGKGAQTRYRVEARGASRTRVRLWPLTGRTNQLRLHLKSLGHAIVGDVLYGGPAAERMYLHAEGLRLAHPGDGRALELHAPLPGDWNV